jgi:hypothetical protein
MNKILLFSLLLPALCFGATRTWSSSGSTDMNNVANYSGSGSFAADDLVFNSTSVINAAATSGITCNSITIASNYTGTWSLSGYDATLGAGFSDDGITGAHNYGNGITCNGASSTFHVGSGVGTITATACALVLNGTTAMTMDDDKGMVLKSITLPASGITTSSGSATTTIRGAATLVTLGANASFTQSSALTLSTNGTGFNLWSIGTGATWGGTGFLLVTSSSGAGSVNVPAITHNANISLYCNAANVTFTQTGAINITASIFRIYATNAITMNYDFNGQNLTCGELRVGCTGATATINISYGEGTHTIASYNGSTDNVGTTNENRESAQFLCSGNWTEGSTHTITPGSSLVTLNGTAAQIVTMNGKQGYDWTVANTGTATIKFADSLSLLGDLTLSDGRDSCGFISCDDYYNATNDSVFQTDSLKIRGSYYRNNAKTKRLAGLIYFYGTSNGTINLVDAGIMGITVINRPGKTISTLSTTRFSQLRNIGGIFIAANAVTDSIFINLDSAAWQADHTIYLKDSSGTSAKNSYTAGIWRTYGIGADTGKVWCGSANKGNVVVNSGAKGWKFNDTVKCLIKKRLAGRVEEKHPMQCTAILDSCSSGDSLITDSSRTITGADANGNSLVRIAGVKVSRGPAMINRFIGSVDQGVLSNGGAISRCVNRKTGGTLQYKDALTTTRLWDSLGGLISFAATSTVDTITTVSTGIKYTIAAGATLTNSVWTGLGGTALAPDTLRSGTPWSAAMVTKPKDTVPYLFITDIISTNGTYLPATSTSGGNNQHVYSLSYTGVTKDVSTGPVGTTVTFTGYGFVGACWVKFGSDSSALSVGSYTSASIAVPAGLAPGVYAVTVGNSDGDIASVGNFTVESGIVLCTLTIAAGANGTVLPSGAQSDTCGKLLPIAAHPNAGFQFLNWTRSMTTALVTDSTAASTTVRRTDSAVGTVTITANFIKKQFHLIMSGSGVTVPANGDTLVDSNSTIAISQTPPDTAHHFTGWQVISGALTLGVGTVTVRGDGLLRANYSCPSCATTRRGLSNLKRIIYQSF